MRHHSAEYFAKQYIGDAILQKTFSADLFDDRQQIKNEGQLPKYYVHDCHPAIIDRDTFQRVQEEIARRSSLRKTSSKNKTEQGKYSSKYAFGELLVCSECGSPYRRVTYMPRGQKRQADGHHLNWLEDKPFTTLFVDGNHENFDLLNVYPEQEWHGGRVHVVRPHVLHLMRGQVFDIGGLAWFTMGGAASHDMEDGILDPVAPDFERRYWALRRMNTRFRVLGRSWWPEEMLSETEYAEAEANLNRAGWCVDCILTHCAPTSIAQQVNRHYQPDKLTDFLETIKGRCQFSKWFCGHCHVNQVIDERFVIQWEQISKVE